MYKCQKCKDEGFTYKLIDGYEAAVPCDCYLMRRAERLLEQSGISSEFGRKTFDNFSDRGDERLKVARQQAMQYAENFEAAEKDKSNSIMLCGQVGAGKTHLGIAISGVLMSKGIPVIYMAYRNAVTRLKQNIIDEEEYNRELNQYTSARVLYIDDLLKGRLTESDINIMYEIINYRYMNNLPIILSTEKSPQDLIMFDEAIGSRLIEMCRGNIIQLQGKELNYRLT